MAALKIHSGLFRTVARIENPVKTPDIAGGNSESFVNPAAFNVVTRMFFRKKSGFRQLEEGTDMLVDEYEAWTWWRSEFENNISKDTRITDYDGRIFKVLSFERVQEDRRYYRFLLITAD